MSRGRWHILHEGAVVTLTRRLPVRFDVFCTCVLPGHRALRLAHLLRQDLWRTLQSLRGFSPVVRVEALAGQLHAQVGGAVEGRFPKAQTEGRIAGLLADPVKRARWIRGAA